MVCPKCGNDCGEFKFCPACGESLGGQKKPQFPKPPVGVYKGPFGYLEIGKESVTFYRKILFKAHTRTIAYDELYAVSYQPGKGWESGFLCVRSWQDRYLPMMSNFQDVKWDHTAISVVSAKNEEYCKVYTFLDQCAQNVRQKHKDELENQEKRIKIPGFYGYMEFGPKSLTVHKESKLPPKTERTIAYDEIAQVAFFEAKGSQRGGLSIRLRDEDKDLDRALRYAAVDDASIDFLASCNDEMREIYQQLTAYADQNKARWAQEHGKDLQSNTCVELPAFPECLKPFEEGSKEQEHGKDPQDGVSVEIPAFPECLKPLEEGSKEQELAEKRRALRASGQVYCPHCLSTSFAIDNLRPSMRYSPIRTPLAALFRLISELLFLINHAVNGDRCACLCCGGIWYAKRWNLQECHVELVSRYLGAYPQLDLAGADGACLQLTKSQVSIRFPEKKGCTILLRELVYADLQKSNGSSCGRLTLRSKANEIRPLPQSLEDARKEKYSIVYTEEQQESFTQVYAVLLAIIEENKKRV